MVVLGPWGSCEARSFSSQLLSSSVDTSRTQTKPLRVMIALEQRTLWPASPASRRIKTFVPRLISNDLHCVTSHFILVYAHLNSYTPRQPCTTSACKRLWAWLKVVMLPQLCLLFWAEDEKKLNGLCLVCACVWASGSQVNNNNHLVTVNQYRPLVIM